MFKRATKTDPSLVVAARYAFSLITGCQVNAVIMISEENIWCVAMCWMLALGGRGVESAVCLPLSVLTSDVSDSILSRHTSYVEIVPVLDTTANFGVSLKKWRS